MARAEPAADAAAGERLSRAPALLAGVTAVEYGGSAALGYAGRLLADLGAAVTKLEPPGGDRTRGEGYAPPGADASALFAYVNAGKRSAVVDDAAPEGRRDLGRLLASAEIVLDGHPASHWRALGLDFGALPGSGRCRLAVSLTPYGRFGERAEWAATHLTAHHGGGEAYAFPGGVGWLRYPGREPVRVPGRVAELDAGAAAALAALAWLAGDREPAAVELTWQEAAIALSRQDIVKWPNDGFFDTRATRQLPVLGLVECRDGWMEIYPSEQHMWERLVEAVGDPEWARALGATADDRIRHTGELNDLFAVWLGERTKREVFDALREFGVPGGPVRTMREIRESAQLRFRGFFDAVRYPDGEPLAAPGHPYIVREAGGPAWRPGPGGAAPPRLGADTRAALAACGAASAPPAPPDRGGAGADGGPPPERPLRWLAGKRVIDLTWYQAGPYACMLLASLGAEVVKVESLRRPDPFRKSRRLKAVMLDELRDGDWVDAGYRFNEVNMGKRSVQVDLSRERGRELVRELAAGADAVVESFRPGVADRLGLGFGRLAEANPRIVMVSLSANGETGPDGHLAGYAAVFGATSGLSGLSGYDRGVPAEYRGPLDQRVGASLATAAIAGLMARDRSGGAIHIDFAAQEAGAVLVGDQLLEWQLRGAVDEPLGNRHPRLAPHNAYGCVHRGEPAWLALAVEDDAGWRRLAERVADRRLDPSWDRRARKAQEPAIDAALADWARGRERDELAAELQALGVAAGPSMSARDLYEDRHLRRRGMWTRVEHARMGELEVLSMPWLVDGARPALRAAPRPRRAQRLRLPRTARPHPRRAGRPRRRGGGVLRTAFRATRPRSRGSPRRAAGSARAAGRGAGRGRPARRTPRGPLTSPPRGVPSIAVQAEVRRARPLRLLRDRVPAGAGRRGGGRGRRALRRRAAASGGRPGSRGHGGRRRGGDGDGGRYRRRRGHPHAGRRPGARAHRRRRRDGDAGAEALRQARRHRRGRDGGQLGDPRRGRRRAHRLGGPPRQRRRAARPPERRLRRLAGRRLGRGRGGRPRRVAQGGRLLGPLPRHRRPGAPGVRLHALGVPGGVDDLRRHRRGLHRRRQGVHRLQRRRGRPGHRQGVHRLQRRRGRPGHRPGVHDHVARQARAVPTLPPRLDGRAGGRGVVPAAGFRRGDLHVGSRRGETAHAVLARSRAARGLDAHGSAIGPIRLPRATGTARRTATPGATKEPISARTTRDTVRTT